jgi:hypothetical protein
MKSSLVVLAAILPLAAMSAATSNEPDIDLHERADANPPKQCKISHGARPNPDFAPFWEIPCSGAPLAGTWRLGTDIKLVCQTNIGTT